MGWMMKHNFKWILFGALLASAGLFVLCGHLMSPSPYTYDIPPNGSRAALIDDLMAELANLESMRDTPYQSAMNDADRLWPHDRLRLVIAIQRHALNRGELPDSIAALMPYLDDTSTPPLANAYRLTLEGNRWTLTTAADYAFARGD